MLARAHTHTHTHTYIYIYIYIYAKVKLATVDKKDPKTPFSLATLPRCREGRYFFFPDHFTLNPYFIMLSAKHRGIQVPFLESLVWIDFGLNPLFPALSRTLQPLGQYIYHHHHHHHIALVARISLTLSHHSSLSFIALGRSSGQHPVSSHSCWMYVRAGRPAFARPCLGIHKSTSLMSSSLLLQQCPACLVRLTWIVFVIGGRWPYSWCLVGCCCQDLFRIARLTKKYELVSGQCL